MRNGSFVRNKNAIARGNERKNKYHARYRIKQSLQRLSNKTKEVGLSDLINRNYQSSLSVEEHWRSYDG